MRRYVSGLTLGFVVAALCAIVGSAAGPNSATDWQSLNYDSTANRYSPLDQINADNVASLGVNWALDLPGERALIGTPLAVDGVIYFTGTFSYTRAVDARSARRCGVGSGRHRLCQCPRHWNPFK